MTGIELAAGVVRAWTRFYTSGLSRAASDARRAEIASDLWEFEQDPDRAGGTGDAIHLIVRVAVGAFDDLSWRHEQRLIEGDVALSRLSRRQATIVFSGIGAALFFVAVWVLTQSPVTRVPTVAVPPLAVAKQFRPPPPPPPPPRRDMFASAGFFGGLRPDDSQVQAAAGLTFDAASIKPNQSMENRAFLVPQPGGRLVGTNITARALVRFAFDLPDFQLVGGPDWQRSARFDVIATAADGRATLDAIRLMLRSLLTERFKLGTHTESRDLQVFAMVLTKGNGQLGPRLRKSSLDCANAAPRPVGAPPPRGGCGYWGPAIDISIPSGRSYISFRGFTAVALAQQMTLVLERTVLDRTGLSGFLDGDFDFTQEFGPPPPPPGVEPLERSNWPSIYTVFPEQLGLKLDGTRAPVEVLVIDSLEKPTVD